MLMKTTQVGTPQPAALAGFPALRNLHVTANPPSPQVRKQLDLGKSI